ncbi:MAG: AAA family ATPase [Methyloligellaceae bacterium]
MITKLAISGYRSLRDVVMPLMQLTVVTGPNGSGKSNVYKAFRLLADIAQGNVVHSIANDGGLQSLLWAGPEKFSRAMKRGEDPVQGVVRSDVISLKMGFAGEDYGYGIELGLPLPVPYPTLFDMDPEIKRECIWTGETLGRANAFADRKGPAVNVRDESGKWAIAFKDLAAFDSMMTHCTDPLKAPEILTIREHMRDWRFYDHFRTDKGSPARRPQIGTRTTILDNEGADVAAAIQTIREIGDYERLDRAVDHAFPGASVNIICNDGYFELEMQQYGLLRPLKASELSDGTLRYLLWIAALLTPRPPGLLVLNEPETSLHPDLLEPLAHLIIDAAQYSQVIVVSHAEKLVSILLDHADCFGVQLYKELGETQLDIEDAFVPAWKWPKR